jgi:hypothetical protein
VRPAAPAGVLVLVAFVLAATAALAGRGTALGLLVLATTALGVAAALTMRATWAASAAPAPRAARTAGAVPADRLDPDQLTLDLRRLHDEHVEKVNFALDEGREDLALELADEYADQALRLITAC